MFYIAFSLIPFLIFSFICSIKYNTKKNINQINTKSKCKIDPGKKKEEKEKR